MKKILNKSHYKFLVTELNHQRDRGLITQNQLDDIMTFYEEGSGLNFIRVLVTIGSLLIGLGILSFVASNWDYMGKILKVMSILGSLGISIFTSFKLEKTYPKTSKALLYLSALIYGAGIFLMGQIFHYGGEFTGAFLLWAIGVLAMSLILREKILFVFAHVLSVVYINGSFDENIITYSLIFIFIFYIGNKYFDFSKGITFCNNLVALNFILYFLNYMHVDPIYIGMSFFLIGFGMYIMNHKLNIDIFKLQGMIVFGISGLILTSKHIWEDLPFIENGNTVSIAFGVLLLIYLLNLVRKSLLTPLFFTCALILRYYFDTLYDFMPKSMFFIFGGLILLGFGHYFERIRKNRGGILDEKTN
ncbi:DUF2157 domain-containing protein [Marinisporobacter balticus]|uniref:Putative membrane protein n=1 Tax=Marinisporobacter balticus TaxID=2018667 RepID=A0A4R2KT08_9FIRM|nr:DUF2157 domain-containing protein [Marinisporobacter balticus]TCO76924.1 putative membrane protein [Marinisporobacter balticus]